MNYAIVEDSIIVNVVVAEADFAEQIGALPLVEGQWIGDVYAPPAPVMTPEEAALDMLADIDYRLGLLELSRQEVIV